MNAAIELSHVTQRFGRKTPTGDARRTVLDDVSLEVPSGQILCLLGPSGCGKTTMVDLVMGNTVPVAGEVRVLGETAPYPTARRRVGYMPQDDALYDDITAEENLRFFGAMYGLGGARLSARIDAVLAFGRLTEGSLVLVVFVAVSLAITSVTLGLLVSGLASDAFQVIQLMLLFVMPQIVLCGLFDLSGTPEWLQALSWCFPVTYGVDALQAVMLRGAGLADIAFEVAMVWAFIVAFFVLAALGFRKKHARRAPAAEG